MRAALSLFVRKRYEKLPEPDQAMAIFMRAFSMQPSTMCSYREVLRQDPCPYCGNIPAPMNRSLEHVIPRSHGGRNSWDNLVGACFPCNQRRGNIPFLYWMVQQQPKERIYI